MPCPDCRGHRLWDDQAWWGCQDCGFASCTIHNTVDHRDRWNEPRDQATKEGGLECTKPHAN